MHTTSHLLNVVNDPLPTLELPFERDTGTLSDLDEPNLEAVEERD
jgi:hypothetical protein